MTRLTLVPKKTYNSIKEVKDERLKEITEDYVVKTALLRLVKRFKKEPVTDFFLPHVDTIIHADLEERYVDYIHSLYSEEGQLDILNHVEIEEETLMEAFEKEKNKSVTRKDYYRQYKKLLEELYKPESE